MVVGQKMHAMLSTETAKSLSPLVEVPKCLTDPRFSLCASESATEGRRTALEPASPHKVPIWTLSVTVTAT
jgi:hypothetical protein